MEEKILLITDKKNKLIASLKINWETRKIEVISNKKYNIQENEGVAQI